VTGVDSEAFEALLTPAGQALLAEVGGADLSEAGLLGTASRLRAHHPPVLVAAALTQARLRVRAGAKFGADADRMYFTPQGLEQSTRASVAAHHATRFAAYLPARRTDQTTLELCSGIGADLIARARAGLPTDAVDRDPLTVAVARANLDALGLTDLARVTEGDATAADPSGYAAVFADPGRRTARGRIFDPRSYEPPLTTVLDLAGRAPAGCVKVAPGIPHEMVPAGAEAEWISDGGEVKEAALWLGALSGGLEGGVGRRATLLPSGATLTPDTDLGSPPVDAFRRYLYEPDGAVIRAHLVAEVVALLDGALVDPNIAYVTSDRLVFTPFATPYEIRGVMPFSLKRLRALLRERRVGILTIKKRGSAVDIERLRKDLHLSGAEEAVLVLTRVGDAPIAVLCDRVD
jgi:THUMP domain-like